MTEMDRLVSRVYATEQMLLATLATLATEPDGKARIDQVRSYFAGALDIFEITANNVETAQEMKDQMKTYGEGLLAQIQFS